MGAFAFRPTTGRLQRRAGGPHFWMDNRQGPRRTFASDTGDLADLTGRNSAGVRLGNAAWGPGPAGPCLLFDGSGGTRVSLPSLGISGAVPFTVMAWLTSTATTLQEWFSFGYGPNENNCELVKDYPSNGDLTVYSEGSPRLTVPYPTPIGNRHHVAMVSTGSAIWLVINGQIAGSGPAAYALHPTNEKYAIGWSGPQNQFPWSGSVDDFRFYSRALTVQEIGREIADPYWRLRPPPNRAILSLSSSASILPAATLHSRRRRA